MPVIATAMGVTNPGVPAGTITTRVGFTVSAGTSTRAAIHRRVAMPTTSSVQPAATATQPSRMVWSTTRSNMLGPVVNERSDRSGTNSVIAANGVTRSNATATPVSMGTARRIRRGVGTQVTTTGGTQVRVCGS